MLSDLEKNKIIEKAIKNKDVLAIALFGSSLKGKGRDVDIGIFLKKKLKNLNMSKIRLDFLKESSASQDIQIFQQLPLYIRVRILKEGKILFVKDEGALYELAFSTIKEFGFYKKLYDLYLKKVNDG